jgi:hypothetical protein
MKNKTTNINSTAIQTYKVPLKCPSPMDDSTASHTFSVVVAKRANTVKHMDRDDP